MRKPQEMYTVSRMQNMVQTRKKNAYFVIYFIFFLKKLFWGFRRREPPPLGHRPSQNHEHGQVPEVCARFATYALSQNRALDQQMAVLFTQRQNNMTNRTAQLMRSTMSYCFYI